MIEHEKKHQLKNGIWTNVKAAIDEDAKTGTKTGIKNKAKATEAKCVDCGEVFQYFTSLTMHVEVEHQGSKNFNCKQCERVFHKKCGIIRHFR